MVIYPLCLEVILSGLLWVELEANDSKALSIDQANRWIRFERLGWVLQNFIVDWSITCVRDLDGLVNGLIWPTARKS